MSTLKAKFELFARLQALGFTYEEAAALRRIEMTLQRWAEAECGDSNDYCSTMIERDEATGKPFRVVSYHREAVSKTRRYPIADREAGALRRLKVIVLARNERRSTEQWAEGKNGGELFADQVIPYHQGDCHGCMLYLCTRAQIGDSPIDQVYNRGVAVCA